MASQCTDEPIRPCDSPLALSDEFNMLIPTECIRGNLKHRYSLDRNYAVHDGHPQIHEHDIPAACCPLPASPTTMMSAAPCITAAIPPSSEDDRPLPRPLSFQTA